MFKGKSFGLCFLSLLLFSCSPETQNTLEVKEPENTKAALSAEDSLAIRELARFNRSANAPDATGIIGVFNIPEMLALVLLDSAGMQDVAQKRAQAFADLESDVAITGAVTDGSPGSIYYNNNPKNFRFECVQLIRDFPVKNPQKSRVVVLEASPMLVYNHKGPYSSLNKAYQRMSRCCDSLKLEQSGPMREFYLVSPIQSSDSSSWLTRIMLPVSRIK